MQKVWSPGNSHCRISVIVALSALFVTMSAHNVNLQLKSVFLHLVLFWLNFDHDFGIASVRALHRCGLI